MVGRPDMGCLREPGDMRGQSEQSRDASSAFSASVAETQQASPSVWSRALVKAIIRSAMQSSRAEKNRADKELTMADAADLQTAYRLAIRDSGGEIEWASMSQSERTRAIYAAMRRLDIAVNANEPPEHEKTSC